MNTNIVRRSKKRMLIVKRYSQKRKMDALIHAKASLAIEGMYLTTQEEKLILKRINDELSDNEFLSRALEIAKNV